MPSPRDERPKDFGGLRDRVPRQPQNFGSFLGELHVFLMELYEAAASVDGNAEGFAQALAHLCAARGLACWDDCVSEDPQQQFFKDGTDPLAQRIIAFWSALVTSSPFLDPSGMLGFLTLASPERVGFSDGEEALFGGADRVRATAG